MQLNCGYLTIKLYSINLMSVVHHCLMASSTVDES